MIKTLNNQKVRLLFDNKEYLCKITITEKRKIYLIRENNTNDELWVKCYFIKQLPEILYGYIDNTKVTLNNCIYTTDNPENESRILIQSIFLNEHLEIDNLKIDNISYKLKNVNDTIEKDLNVKLETYDLILKKSIGLDLDVEIKNINAKPIQELKEVMFFLDIFFNIFSQRILTREEEIFFLYKNKKIQIFYTPKYLKEELFQSKKYLCIKINEDTLKNFYNKYEEFPLIFQLFYNILANYDYLVLENKFLAFAQILEAIDRDISRKEIKYNSEYRIKERKDACFINHLKYLFDTYRINLHETKIEKIQSKIKDIRHTLTHIEKNREYIRSDFHFIIEFMKSYIIYIFARKVNAETIQYSLNTFTNHSLDNIIEFKS